MITSLDNNKIKNIIKLRDNKNIKEENKFIIEGIHLIEEAYKKGLLLEIYKLEGFDISFNVETNVVTEQIMKKISTMDSMCNIIGICKTNISNEIKGNKILLLDAIQNPGNLGTILRSALGFNIDTVILGLGTCNLYNEKVLRSTGGAIFNLNIVVDNLEKYIEEIKKRNIPLYGTNVNNGIDVRKIENKETYAIIMGNEGNGLNEKYRNMCDKNIYIKTNDKLESLNVAMATSIILYELDKE